MRIINLIDSLAKINYGVWNAAISTSNELRTLGANSVLVGPSDLTFELPKEYNLPVYHPENTGSNGLRKMIAELKLDSSNDVIVSHGCWRYPNQWGAQLAKLGFKWIATPHGMLEPYSLQQKKWFKKIYLPIFELPRLLRANLLRAVSGPEAERLKIVTNHPSILFIPNAVNSVVAGSVDEVSETKYSVLFLGRLHNKKNPYKLVRAWTNSKLYLNPNYELIIAGPDQDQLAQIESYLAKKEWGNISYLGAIYGEEKDRLLNRSSFFVLPSTSEGLPTSVLEAMQHGCVCLISEGCNFPEAIKAGVALPIGNKENSIIPGLNAITEISSTEIDQISVLAKAFVEENYSLRRVAGQQFATYQKLLMPV